MWTAFSIMRAVVVFIMDCIDSFLLILKTIVLIFILFFIILCFYDLFEFAHLGNILNFGYPK